MKNFKKHLPLATTYLLAIMIFPVFVFGENTNIPQVKKSGNITYIDIGIHQPNVEDCYGMSVPEQEIDNSWIKIFPNPNPGQFTLELQLRSPSKALSVQLYDLAGKLMFESKVLPDGNQFRKDLDVSHLQKGVYFIRITGNDCVGVKQIIIN